MPKGRYRTQTLRDGAEYAFVDYGLSSNFGALPRALYEVRGYEPPFDELPTKEAYEAGLKQEDTKEDRS